MAVPACWGLSGSEAGHGRGSLLRGLEEMGRRWSELVLLPCSVLRLCCPQLTKEALE